MTFHSIRGDIHTHFAIIIISLTQFFFFFFNLFVFQFDHPSAAIVSNERFINIVSNKNFGGQSDYKFSGKAGDKKVGLDLNNLEFLYYGVCFVLFVLVY